MVKFLSILLTGIVTSIYLFPIFFKALPEQNTKNLMAAFGIILFVLHSCAKRKLILNKNYILLFILAIIFSLAVYLSITLNSTYDMAYARFIVSIMIWMSAAYFVCSTIRLCHGRVNIDLVSYYLIGVCVAQCLLALMINNNIEFKNFINAYIEQGQSFLDKGNVNRLYGIGASLDVAGSRFSAVLVIIAFMMLRKSNNNFILSILIVAFFIIAIVGNMVARTTTVGMILGLVFMMYHLHLNGYKYRRLIYWISSLCILFIPILAYMYSHNSNFERLLKFGFEGFISLFEKGEWYTSSNEILTNMVVFPDNIKTWLIGDGYFDNPFATDPYFIGEYRGGFYKGTDIGYLRFIFYCGLIGLSVLIAYMFKATDICIKRFKDYKAMFLLLLAVNMIVWLKVSTDIFLVFAIYLCIPQEDNEAFNKSIALNS